MKYLRYLVVCLGLAATVPLCSAAPKTSEPLLETLDGVVVGRSRGCLRFRTKAGDTISLMGVAPATRTGTLLRLHGQWAQRSICQSGRTFQVRTATAI